MVPKFDSFFTPYLKCLSDENIHKNKDLVEFAIKYFGLTEEEAQERIANQSQTQVYNRVLWAGTYLRKAGFAKAHMVEDILMRLQTKTDILQ